nr:uncharacterized protein LOC119621910 isoform X2 [Chlorocebus sabaeus]
MWLLLPPEGALGEELQVPQQSMAASWLNLGWIKKYVGEALQQQENCERHKHLPIESYETPSMDHYETPVAEHLGTPTTNLLPRPQQLEDLLRPGFRYLSGQPILSKFLDSSSGPWMQP